MKLTSVRYLVGNGFKNIWLNKLMSIASIGVLVACMSVIGLAVALSINVDKALSDLEQENVVNVYFDDRNAALYADNGAAGNGTYNDITEEDYLIHDFGDALLLCAELEKIENVSSVRYFSGDDALRKAMESMTPESTKYYEEFLEKDEYGNPMQCGAKVTFNDLSKFDETLQTIEKTEGVDHVYSSKAIAEKITAIKKAISIIGFWIVAILLLISLMIVSNTIRVTMYNRKLEISIMKAVGATDSFVRLPFMIEGVTIGLLSAGITTVILYFVYNAVDDVIMMQLNLVALIPFTRFFWYIFGIFAVIGCFAGLFSSAFMINKYLRKEGSEFRAL